jgi:phosphopantothenoylcysteine decarboxylase/phosphopantothenate--cysteine ligase
LSNSLKNNRHESKGKPFVKLLVSAGPTREFFDSVRFISNPSSGKMGYAIARAAGQRGHQVTLVSGPVAIDPPRGVTFVSVTTAAEMAAACKRAFRAADVAVMTAAVCDYRPVQRSPRKLAKAPKPKRVLLEPTEDIAASLGRRKGRRLLIGFAMEDTKNARRKAERKLKKKNCDLIVLNGIENVGSDDAVVELYTPGEGWSRTMRGSKAAIARRLVQLIEMKVASEF